jgi:CubicO group peptidase (beta-lactamase class C family)
MKAQQVPGLAVVLIEDGQPVFLKTYGVASVEQKQSLQSDTISTLRRLPNWPSPTW